MGFSRLVMQNVECSRLRNTAAELKPNPHSVPDLNPIPNLTPFCTYFPHSTFY